MQIVQNEVFDFTGVPIPYRPFKPQRDCAQRNLQRHVNDAVYNKDVEYVLHVAVVRLRESVARKRVLVNRRQFFEFAY